MRLVVLAAIAIAVVLLAPARPGHACSCGPTMLTYPADGAAGVPTNVVIVIADRPSGDAGTELTLEGPSGPVPIEISLVVERGATIELVRPLQPLDATSEYTLRSQGPLATFQTGSLADAVAPQPVELGELTVAHAGTVLGGGCGDEFTYIDLPITAPADAVAVDLFVDTLDGRTHYIVPAERISWGLSNWSSGCEMRIQLQPGEGPCFEVRSRDQAGNLGDPVERCATVTHCADIPDSEAFDGDLSDCEPYVEPEEPPPSDGGCSTSTPSAGALLLLALAAGLCRRRDVAAAAIGMAALFIAPRPAAACSCYVPMTISPANGATDVPTNAVFVITSGWSDETSASLTGPDGAHALETTLEYDGIERLELVQPVEPLAPSTDYVLTVGSETIGFRTAAGADTEPPAPAELGELTIKHAHPAGQGSSCGDEHLDIDLAITLPPDAVAAEIFVEGFGQQFRHVVAADQIDWPLGGSSEDCTRNFPLEGGDQVCFEIRSRDQAGNLAAATERCTTVIACAPNDEGDLTDCEPAPPGMSSSAGCAAAPEPPTALALVLLALYAVRRSCRYARKCRIAARADSRSPARS